MWRSVALAIGILVTLAGAQCMVVEKMQLIIQRPPETEMASPLAVMSSAVSRPEIIEIPEWAPWSLMSVGIVMLLYSATMPKPA